MSIGIEVTNGSLFMKAKPPPGIALTPSLTTLPVGSLQTGEVVGGSVTEDRERLDVAWVDGTTGAYLYVFPSQAQLEGVTALVAWLCSGTEASFIATFLNAHEQSHWRQHLVRTTGAGAGITTRHSFLLHGNPVWRDESFNAFDGIFAHSNFDGNRGDGGPVGLYAWLRLYCGQTPAKAYMSMRTLQTSTRGRSRARS